MADIAKTEYHLLPPGSREADDWFDDRAEAIKAAEAKGVGWRVQEVVSYLEERAVIFTAGASEEECPICGENFLPEDLCATDIDEGVCHADCLKGSPVVDLASGEPTAGDPAVFRYDSLPRPA